MKAVGNMAIFQSREAAERFVAQDPFIYEGLVKSPVIRDCNDRMRDRIPAVSPCPRPSAPVIET